MERLRLSIKVLLQLCNLGASLLSAQSHRVVLSLVFTQHLAQVAHLLLEEDLDRRTNLRLCTRSNGLWLFAIRGDATCGCRPLDHWTIGPTIGPSDQPLDHWTVH